MKSVGQRGLANAGYAFNQQVAARENGNQGKAQHFIVAADDRLERLLNGSGSCAGAAG